jgi:hypothetical protein
MLRNKLVLFQPLPLATTDGPGGNDTHPLQIWLVAQPMVGAEFAMAVVVGNRVVAHYGLAYETNLGDLGTLADLLLAWYTENPPAERGQLPWNFTNKTVYDHAV